VLIGHSKLFTHQNEKSLQPFLKFVMASPGKIGFGTFRRFCGDPKVASMPPIAHASAA